MPFQQFAPKPNLKPFVKGYFTLQVNEKLSKSRVEKLLPNGYPLWVFHYGERGCGIDHKSQITTLPKQYFLGQTTAEHYFEHTGKVDVMGIIFKPAALSHLFQISMHELTDNLENPELIIGSQASAIYNQIQEIPLPQKRVDFIEGFLNLKLANSNQGLEEVDKIINYLQTTSTLPKVKEMNDMFGFHRDSLRQRFYHKIGIAPKMYLRILRFLNIIKDGLAHPQFDLQDLVYRTGFYDQSHFTKEFKKFAGITPKKFFNQKKEQARPLSLLFS